MLNKSGTDTISIHINIIPDEVNVANERQMLFPYPCCIILCARNNQCLIRVLMRTPLLLHLILMYYIILMG